jgi:hypothetical protein
MKTWIGVALFFVCVLTIGFQLGTALSIMVKQTVESK